MEEGLPMIEHLKCNVVNCVHNSNYCCTADDVFVYQNREHLSDTSAGTSCKTFKPRSSYRTIGFK
jgi:hypothetical protein